MPHLDNVRPIKDITYGGPVQQGHGVVFTVAFDGGEQENYYCRSDQLGKLVAKLLSFGSMAEQLLAGTPKSAVRISTPFEVTRFSGTGHSNDGKVIGLAVVTADGFPLELSMSVEQANDAIAKLQAEILRASKPRKPVHRN